MSNFATFTQQPLLRVLPEDNATLDVQDCERLRARLTVASCAARWSRSADKPGEETPYTICRGCVIGRGNYMKEREKLKLSERDQAG